MAAPKPQPKRSGVTPASALPEDERARLVAQVHALDETIEAGNREIAESLAALKLIPQNRRNRNVLPYLQAADTVARVVASAARARSELIGAHPGLLAATTSEQAGAVGTADGLEAAIEADE